MLTKKLAIMIPEKDLDGDLLYKKVKSLLNEDSEYKEIKNNLLKRKNISSSEIIYNEIKENLRHVK